MALDPKTKKAEDDFTKALKALPAKVPDAAKKDYASLMSLAETWAEQVKKYAEAVEKALDHSKYDQKVKELEKAKDEVNDSVNLANQIKSNYFGDPGALGKLAQKVADKDKDLSIKLTFLVAAASAVNGLKLPDKIP